LGDLFYRLGSAAGTIEAYLVDRPIGEVAVYDDEGDDVHDPEAAEGDVLTLEPDAADLPDDEADDDEADDDEDSSSGAVIAGAWILATIFRPRSVRWSRVIVSGVAATLLSDFVGRMADPTPVAGREPFARDADELQSRLGAGVATAAGYAALLYPRIPGPPLFRGLVFGALEVVASPKGGLINLITRTPGIRFPLHRLARPVDEDAGPMSRLAFGIGLGLLYRYYEE
jgi:hypothetical protein